MWRRIRQKIGQYILLSVLGLIVIVWTGGLVEEILVGKNSVVYANTNRGSAEVRFFGELDKVLPVKEEESKFLSVSY